VWERRGEVGRAHEDVDLREIAGPGGAGGLPPAFLLDDRRQRCELLGTGLVEGEQQPDLEPERLGALAGVVEDDADPEVGQAPVAGWRQGPGERLGRRVLRAGRGPWRQVQVTGVAGERPPAAL
jgi:hypothetical protein